MKQSYDIVIVGSGIGGLSTLLYLSETTIYKEGNLSICLLVKASLDQTNTYWAQGGIAAVKSIDDNFEKHINDTLTAGAFLNDKYIVEKVINQTAWTAYDPDRKEIWENICKEIDVKYSSIINK